MAQHRRAKEDNEAKFEQAEQTLNKQLRHIEKTLTKEDCLLFTEYKDNMSKILLDTRSSYGCKSAEVVGKMSGAPDKKCYMCGTPCKCTVCDTCRERAGQEIITEDSECDSSGRENHECNECTFCGDPGPGGICINCETEMRSG